MKLYLYANFNVLGGFFGPMIQERIEPDEMQKNYAQIVAGLDVPALARLKECDLYCLGSIDNVTGDIVPEKQFLLHCGEVCDRFLASKVKDQKEENHEQA